MFRFNTFENLYLLHLPALEYENRAVSANNTIKFMFRPSFRFAGLVRMLVRFTDFKSVFRQLCADHNLFIFDFLSANNWAFPY